jgi:hypothetical protein
MATKRGCEVKFDELVGYFRRSAKGKHQPSVKNKLGQLCAEFDRTGARVAQNPAKMEEITQRLGDLKNYLEACDVAEGGQSLCIPFFEKAEKVIGEYRRI